MSKPPSKFSAIIDHARGREPEPDPSVPPESPPPIPTAPATPLPAAFDPPAPPAEPPSKGRGRPKGKRSDPDFEQVTAYLPSALYTRVRIALLEDGRRQEFSDLVADLLSAWLDGRIRD